MVNKLVTSGCVYGFEYYCKSANGPFSNTIVSEAKLQMVENKCTAVLNDCMKKANDLIVKNAKLIRKYADVLKRDFTLTRDDILRIYKQEIKVIKTA